jgi:hypothetical protein
MKTQIIDRKTVRNANISRKLPSAWPAFVLGFKQILFRLFGDAVSRLGFSDFTNTQ